MTDSHSQTSSVGRRHGHKRMPKWRRQVAAFVDHKYVTIIMTVFTIYALFGDDLRLATTKPSGDDVFFGLSAIALFLFTAELILNSLGKADYVCGFYFWLDLLATASLIPDIGWIWNEIVDNEGGSSDATGAVKAGRASRAGTRAGRIVRIVRLVRLIRIAKLYKHVRGEEAHKAEQALNAEEDEMGTPVPDAETGGDVEAPAGPAPVEDVEEPSAVGKHLSDLTTRRVIILVLAMIIMIPLFDVNTWTIEPDTTQLYVIDAAHQAYFAANGDTSNPFYQAQLRLVANENRLMYLQLNNTDQDSMLRSLSGLDTEFLETLSSIDDEFRTDEALGVSTAKSSTCLDANAMPYGAEGDCQSFAFFNNKFNTVLEAWLNIAKTFFIMIVLAFGAVMFTRDAERIVIGPIERMVKIVKKLAEDPLAAVHANDGEGEDQKHQHYETKLLVKTLEKISMLLQIGFGEAGSEIISKNMHGGEMDAVAGGKMMTAVFGFCDIRQFTDATECLQAQVMGFVNQIGGIVHFACSQYSGSVNKNIGDAFLLVWRLDDPPPAMPVSDTMSTPTTPFANAQYSHSPVAGAAPNRRPRQLSPLSRVAENGGAGSGSGGGGGGGGAGESKDTAFDFNPLDEKSTPPPRRPASPASSSSRALKQRRGSSRPDNLSLTTFITDSALYSFLKMMVDIENSNQHGFLRQWQDHPAVQRRFKGKFWVRMGYGLHTGWAVEGAIGSRYKIDASYLSPNVNMASRLEAATKQFRTPLLVSHEFWKNLSPDAKSMTRCIDRVTVKGSTDPIKLYTVDVTHIPKRMGVTEHSLSPKELRTPASRDMSFKDPDTRSLQKDLHPQFYPTFARAMDAYFEGDFTTCRMRLEEGLKFCPGDGPTQTLMEVISRYNFMAPPTWKGYRELTEK